MDVFKLSDTQIPGDHAIHTLSTEGDKRPQK